jgi:hypothetical protein
VQKRPSKKTRYANRGCAEKATAKELYANRGLAEIAPVRKLRANRGLAEKATAKTSERGGLWADVDRTSNVTIPPENFTTTALRVWMNQAFPLKGSLVRHPMKLHQTGLSKAADKSNFQGFISLMLASVFLNLMSFPMVALAGARSYRVKLKRRTNG